MNPRILQSEVQLFLSQQAGRDPADIALAGSPFAGISGSELAAQLDGRERSRRKLPTWHAQTGIYYPGRLNIEQSSSEVTAIHKASLIPPGCRLLDMTGGLGVDSYHFARQARSVTYCELDPVLGAIAAYNFSVLGATNITSRYGSAEGDGIKHLEDAPEGYYDVVYLDPARRSGSQKVFMLGDSVPDVRALQSLLLKKSPQILVKLSPMLDIRAALRELNHVAGVQVISVGGECKELLFCLEADTPERPGDDAVTVTTVMLEKSGADLQSARRLVFTLEEESICPTEFGPVSTFLYDPDAAVLKAGAFKLVGQRFGLTKLHPHTHLYTSSRFVEDFPGRISRVERVTPYPEFKKSRETLHGSAIARNFPLKSEQVRKKHRIAEAAERYFYFCRDSDERLLVIEAERLNLPTR